VSLQQVAQRKLAEAEAERARLLSRAGVLHNETIAGSSLESNLQNLTERLRNVERVCEEQNRVSAFYYSMFISKRKRNYVVIFCVFR